MPWRELPHTIEIEPTNSCNLRCRMCHVSFMPDEPRPTLDVALLDKLDCLKGAYFSVGSSFEPMMHRDFASIIRKITDIGGAIELISNGSLISNDIASALLDCDLRLMTFSFDGIKPATYEHIRRRSNYPKTMDAILNLRGRFTGRSTEFAINSTIMRRNVPEIVESVAFWDAAGFDLLRFINMVVRNNEPELIRESLYPDEIRQQYRKELDAAALDVIAERRNITLTNPWFRQSPIAAEFPRNVLGSIVVSDRPGARVPHNVRRDQLGAGPGMSFSCNSPWTFARISHDGDVQLCYQFSIGNLKTQSFEEIWFGDKAEAVRRRVIAERQLCETCDYYRFCINGLGIDTDDKESYLAGPLLAGIDSIDFEAGTMTAPETPPILIETIGAFNIVRFRGGYLGVPHAFGSVDLSQQDVGTMSGLITADNLHGARRLVRAAQKTTS